MTALGSTSLTLKDNWWGLFPKSEHRMKTLTADYSS